MTASTSFPLDCWYVAAESAEVVPGALLGRRLLGRDVLLYRTASGAVAALEDRCAHRALPLSLGRLVDDRVVCGYHGFTYDSSGACVAVPSQPNPPYGARVPSWPVTEQGPFVWVWVGNARRAPAHPVPALPELESARWAVTGGATTVAAGFGLLHENALDRTHFAFVHPATTHGAYLSSPPPLDVEVSETSVSYSREFPAGPLAAWQARATGLPADLACVQRESGTFVSPALHVDRMDVVPADGPVLHSVFVRAFTPVDDATTRVTWRVARDYATGDAEAARTLHEVHEQTMEEDRPLLEAIQATISRDGDRHVNAAADVASVKVQTILRRMLAEERPGR